MPIMPRYNKKATKIAYKILSMPNNLAHKPTPREIYINKRLLREDTMRVR